MIPTPWAVGKMLLRAALLGVVEGLIIGSAALAMLAAALILAAKVLR